MKNNNSNQEGYQSPKVSLSAPTNEELMRFIQQLAVENNELKNKNKKLQKRVKKIEATYMNTEKYIAQIARAYRNLESDISQIAFHLNINVEDKLKKKAAKLDPEVVNAVEKWDAEVVNVNDFRCKACGNKVPIDDKTLEEIGDCVKGIHISCPHCGTKYFVWIDKRSGKLDKTMLIPG